MVSADLTPPPILIVCGPTGSGKGRLARELAERLDGEIVLADSRKVYHRFDIGTAKPSPGERGRIPHHLVDVCEPDEVFTAARYVRLADRAIVEIRERGRRAIVCGGTGLYLRALLHGIAALPPRDESIRAELLRREAAEPGCLRRQLQREDPRTAGRIPPADLMRTVRALEVFLISGRPISELQAAHGFAPVRYRALELAPDWDRDELYRRIDRRVDRMMAAGLLEEVRTLLADGLGRTRAFGTLGYSQIGEYLEGHRSLEQALEKIRVEHRRYARRQLTWFRRSARLRWLPAPVDLDGLLREMGYL